MSSWAAPPLRLGFYEESGRPILLPGIRALREPFVRDKELTHLNGILSYLVLLLNGFFLLLVDAFHTCDFEINLVLRTHIYF